MQDVDELMVIADALIVVRDSIERGRNYVRGNEKFLASIFIEIETARFPLATAVSQLRRRSISDQDLLDYILAVGDVLRAIIKDGDKLSAILSIDIYRSVRGRKDLYASYVAPLLAADAKSSNFADLLYNIVRAIDEFIALNAEPHRRGVSAAESQGDDLIRLRSIVPAQRIAPVHFDIHGHRLFIVKTKSQVAPGSDVVVSVAYEELKRRGNEIVEQLQRSNCDPRLLRSAVDLQIELEQSQNAVKLGIANIYFSSIVGRFDQELPEALSGALHAHTVSVGMYISQFPDWIVFSESSSHLGLAAEEMALISATVRSVADATEAAPEISDLEVPKSLRALANAVSDPKTTSVKIALALVRTIENLVIRVFSYGGDLIEKTISKTIDTVSSAAARFAAVGLLTIAVSAAAYVVPLAGKIDGLYWIKSATEIVSRQIESLSK